MSPKILIVGAGPVGLCLALILLRNGIPVRIIEKNTSHRIGRKGFGVHARTIELHKILGTLEDLEEHWLPSPVLCVYAPPDGTKVIKTMSLAEDLNPTPACPWVNSISIGQDRHEALFRRHLEKYGCFVEAGTELVSFTQFEDHVVAHLKRSPVGGDVVEEDAEFKWLIGTDGAHSLVRKTLGLTYLGETRRDQDFATGDIIVKKGLKQEDNTSHLWATDSAMIALLPSEVPGTNVFTFTISGRTVDCIRVVNSRDEWLKWFEEHTGRKDIDFGDFIWISHWTPNIRMVDSAQKGRVFLAGDSFHCHPPAGAQGLNSGLQDAFNLAWKLALVEKNLAPPSLLGSYSHERIPVIAAMLGKTTMLYDRLTSSYNDQANWKRGKEMHQLGVNYRGSPILVDEFHTEPHDPLAHDAYGTGISVPEGSNLHAGDRAPQAPGLVADGGITTSLFDIYDPSHHTVLVFTKELERYVLLSDALKKYPKELFRVVFILPKGLQNSTKSDAVVIDNDGHAYDAYTSGGEDRVVIVRPDGVIGAIVRDVHGLYTYLAKVFLD